MGTETSLRLPHLYEVLRLKSLKPRMGTETNQKTSYKKKLNKLKSLKPRMGTETNARSQVHPSDLLIKIIKTPHGDGNQI